MGDTRLVWAGGVSACILCASAWADVLTVNPRADATIIQENDQLANGSGYGLFCGNIAAGVGFARRALVKFDVSAIPPGSTINSVTVTFTLTRVNASSPTVTISLYRLLTDWHEGPSAAGSSQGAGVGAVAGDTTWRYTFYNLTQWGTLGGDFAPTPSASRSVGQTLTAYTWGTTPGLVADVQAWVDNPGLNFGWILVGDESRHTTTRRFASREVATTSQRPRLVIDYTPVPSPGAGVLILGTGLAGLRRRRGQ
jgi:hypothetical protein